MAKNRKSNWDDLDPQKSSAAQFITYVASVGGIDERYEIRYENENIWMSQKMLAQVYGVEINTVNYHVKKIFADAELDESSVIRKIRITGPDGKSYQVNHYGLQVVIALGFKIDNEKAIAFRKWANQVVTEYTIKGWVMDVPRLKDGSPITDKYFEHQLERIREIRLSERKFYQKVTDPLVVVAFRQIGDWMGIPQQIITIDTYVPVVLKLIVAFGLVFQMPLIIFVLGCFGLVTSKALREKRRAAIVIAFVLAMFLTPPDPMSQIMMAVPLCLLYEVSVWAVWLKEKGSFRRKGKDAA